MVVLIIRSHLNVVVNLLGDYDKLITKFSATCLLKAFSAQNQDIIEITYPRRIQHQILAEVSTHFEQLCYPIHRHDISLA